MGGILTSLLGIGGGLFGSTGVQAASAYASSAATESLIAGQQQSAQTIKTARMATQYKLQTDAKATTALAIASQKYTQTAAAAKEMTLYRQASKSWADILGS